MREIDIPNEDKIIEKALRGLKSGKGKGIPAAKIKTFIARVGELLERNGKLEKTEVDELARQVKSGEL